MRYVKWLKITCVFLVLIALGYLGLHFWQTRGWQKVCGTYLVGGGETYVTITGKAGWLKAEGCVNSYWPSTEGAKKETTASFSGGVLELRQTVTIQDNPTAASSGKPASEVLIDTRIELRPSTASPQDWDLHTGLHSVRYIIPFGGILSQMVRNPEMLLDKSQWGAFLQVLRGGGLYDGRAEYAPPKPAFVSFLHRVDDPAVADYFEKRFKNETGENVLQMARDLQARHPQDVYLMLHCAEMEALFGKVEVADKL